MTRFNLLLLAFLFSGSVISKAQCSGTATAATSGNVGGGPTQATWTLSGGATSVETACLIVIPIGIAVDVKTNTTWIGSVEIYGTLTLTNQLALGTTTGCGLTLKIFGSGILAETPPSASNRLSICGTVVVSSQPVLPPGAIGWPADGSFDAGDLGGSGGGFGETGVLPVELLFFKVSSDPENGYPYLEWATASELNFDFFLLEHSTNGVNFTELEKVSGHGTSNERHDYSYIDSAPFIGRTYYRLTAVDFDGLRETFNIVTIKYLGEKKARLFPNPISSGRLNIVLNYAPLEVVKIVITDLNGIEQSKFIMTTNEASFILNLKSGGYLVSIHSGDFNQSQRLIVD